MAEKKPITLWNKETMAKAALQHKYIFVSANQKQKKYKILSGSEKAWNPKQNKPELNYIYISELRIMGLQEDVVNELKLHEYTDDEIKNFVKSAYTKDNHGAEYYEEIKKATSYKKSLSEANHENIKYGLEDLDWFVEALKDAKEEPIDKVSNKINKIVPKSRRDIFRDLYDRCKQNKKIVDVSGLETVGAKARDQPTKKGYKVYSEKFNIETDNIKNYKKAIEWIHGSVNGYEDDIENMKTLLAEKKKGTKSSKPAGTNKSTGEPNGKKSVSKKKNSMLGSPRKQGLPNSKSPGAIKVTGGDNFTPIPKM